MTVRKGSLAPIKTALLPAPFLVRTIREETGPLRPATAGATVSTGVSDPREQPALALLVGKPARDPKLTLLGNARSAGTNFLPTRQTI